MQVIPISWFLAILCSLACTSPGRALLISTKNSPFPPSNLCTRKGDDTALPPQVKARGSPRSSVALPAKKRLRRRKDDDSDHDARRGIDSRQVGDGLPDFDLDSPEDEPQKKSSAQPVNLGEITPLMMGDANKSVRSVQELISDRSLETKFVFEEKGDDTSIPDFAQLAQTSASSSSSLSLNDGMPVGKKKLRQDERRTNSSTTKEIKQGDNPLSNLPFLTNDAGEFSPIKLLEAGGKRDKIWVR
jgi:hypothetical protein